MHISEYDGGMKGRGFTLVELIIAIAVMAILLVLATLSFRNYQAAARDKEREADVLANTKPPASRFCSVHAYQYTRFEKK